MGHFDCRSCELGDCSRSVSGEGDIHSGLFLCGTCPGADEEVIGRPFVGRSGKLLDVCLKQALLKREEVYINNIIKCMTPNNRDPMNSEIRVCTDKYLEKEIKKGNPKIIVALGRVAINYFTSIDSVQEARDKKVIRLIDRDFVVIPTYHPSWALRRGKKLADVKLIIEDLTRVKHALDIVQRKRNSDFVG